MYDPKSEDEPKVKTDASKGGSGSRRTAIGAGDNNSNPIHLAQEEARRLGHNFVGTEALLVALVRCRSGIASEILSDLGLTVENTRVEMESIIGRGTGFVAVEIPFTPHAKQMLELAWKEAQQLGHNYLGTEHLLLGLAQVPGVAMRILENFGVDEVAIRERVKQKLNSD